MLDGGSKGKEEGKREKSVILFTGYVQYVHEKARWWLCCWGDDLQLDQHGLMVMMLMGGDRRQLLGCHRLLLLGVFPVVDRTATHWTHRQPTFHTKQELVRQGTCVVCVCGVWCRVCGNRSQTSDGVPDGTSEADILVAAGMELDVTLLCVADLAQLVVIQLVGGVIGHAPLRSWSVRGPRHAGAGPLALRRAPGTLLQRNVVARRELVHALVTRGLESANDACGQSNVAQSARHA